MDALEKVAAKAAVTEIAGKTGASSDSSSDTDAKTAVEKVAVKEGMSALEGLLG